MARTCDVETLNHPMILPLAKLLGRELDVVRAAYEVKGPQRTRFPHERTVLNLLELRTAIAAWEGTHQGQVRQLNHSESFFFFFFVVELENSTHETFVLGRACSR